MSEVTERFHILRLEVTVAAVLQDPDDKIVGNNMVDATIAFGWRTSTPPERVSDAAVNAALSKQMGPVLALITTALTFNGWVAMGSVAEPMNDKSHPTGELSQTTPVTVHVTMVDGPAARA